MNRALLQIGLALLGIGLVLVLRDGLHSQERFDGLRVRAADLGQLRHLEEEAAALTGARNLVEREAGGEAPPLSDLAAEHLGNAVSIQPVQPVQVDADWGLRRVELAFEGVDWTRIGRFLERLDATRPRWMVRSLTLQAGADGKGSGRLVVQVLERSEASP